MPTFLKIIPSTMVVPLGSSDDWPAGLVTPQNIPRESDGGGANLRLWSDPTGENTPPTSISQVLLGSTQIAPSEQIQIGSGETVGTGTYYGVAEPYQAPSAMTTLATKKELIYAFDPSTGEIIGEAWVMSSYAQAAAGANASLSIDDATGFSEGQSVCTSSTVGVIQTGSTFEAPGTLVVQTSGDASGNIVGACIVGTID